MSRRYLSHSEAQSALNRGKAIEAFLGGCFQHGVPGIRWVQIRASSKSYELRVYESADPQDPGFLDVYEFGPLNPDLEFDEAEEIHEMPSFEACVALVDARSPGASSRFVNEFMIQDEYADYQCSKSEG